jgi:hypothetical protein
MEPWTSLVPDFVTTLTMPPSARPYSALKLLFMTRNSLTASCDGVARCDPLAARMLSAPSTVTALFRSRWPPKEIRMTFGSVKGDWALVWPTETFGLRRAKSVKRRPLTGRAAICSVFTTWLISVRVGSITGVSPVTTTVSSAWAILSVMSMVAFWATLRPMPVRVYLANPPASAVSSYRPGGTSGKMYNPSAEETVWKTLLVAMSRSVIDVFTTAPPVSSRTAPFNCACAVAPWAARAEPVPAPNAPVPAARRVAISAPTRIP